MAATTSGDTIAVTVLAAHAVVRAGLKHTLGSQARMLFAGEASTMDDAVSLATQTKASVALVDPDSDGVPFHAISALYETGSRVLVLTAATDVRFHQRAFELGAAGVVSKDHSLETLIRAIERVHAGEMWLERGKTASLLSAVFSPQDPEHAKIQTLTKRELEIVALVGNGLKNVGIGTRLFISAATVRNHLTSILSKLELTDRFELAVYAFRHGLVTFEAAQAMPAFRVIGSRGGRNVTVQPGEV